MVLCYHPQLRWNCGFFLLCLIFPSGDPSNATVNVSIITITSSPLALPFHDHFLPTLPVDYEGDSEEEVTTTAEPLPQFDPDNPTNITVHLGSTTFLHCKVSLLKDKTISWVKVEGGGGEVKLLTFGLHTYSNDLRLSINFERETNNWKLRIKRVERGDAGGYQCVVSSHPPKTLFVTLTVIVPKINIVDDLGRPVSSDKYYNAGSTLELRCVISNLPPAFTILWRHQNTTLNYDTSRGGISVKTTVRNDSAVSVLYIANARANDSGLYVCALGDLSERSILVHVMIGETPAAMQHSNKGTMGKEQQLSVNFLLLLVVLQSFQVFCDFFSFSPIPGMLELLLEIEMR